MTTPLAVKLDMHAHDLDDDGHDTAASGFTPVIANAECNSPAVTSATPNLGTNLLFDSFYDHNQSTVAGLSSVAGIGLTYSGGFFTATEDGIWILNIGIEIVANPGSTGSILLDSPTYGYRQRIVVKAASNDYVLNGSSVQFERTLYIHATESFQFVQKSAGASVQIVNGYAVVEIMRIADALS